MTDKMIYKPFFEATDEAIKKGFEIQRDIIAVMQKSFEKQLKAKDRQIKKLQAQIRKITS